MAEPQTLAQNHPFEVWGALVGSVTLVLGMVTVLYNRLNKDITGQQTQLDSGAKAFIEVGKELVRVAEKLAALQDGASASAEEMDQLKSDIKRLHDKVLVLETEHKPCQELLKELKKGAKP